MRSIAYPYKFSVCHELKPDAGASCVKFCGWFLDFASNENMLNEFCFSDEARFHLSGFINVQNFRTWSATNPHQFMESPLHPQKNGFFCAMPREKIAGPFTTTINGGPIRRLDARYHFSTGSEWTEVLFPARWSIRSHKRHHYPLPCTLFWKTFN